MKLRDNSLSIVVLTLFVLFLGGQSFVGYRVYVDEQTEHHQPGISYPRYLTTSHFGEAVFENWESEFLQMGAYVLLTAFLVQRGSAESKDPDKFEPADEDPEKHRTDPRAPAPVRRGGPVLKVYEHSLSLALFLLFFLSFAGHAVVGRDRYNAEQLTHGQAAVSVLGYLGSSQFWFESLQNWQSEFLAVFTLAMLSTWLRQRGSPESKPVATPHEVTGKG
jgi:hypothetical protein